MVLDYDTFGGQWGKYNYESHPNRCKENSTGTQTPIPLKAPTVEVQREEYGAVEVESVLTVGVSSRRMTVECVAYNVVGVSSDTFAMEVSGEHWRQFELKSGAAKGMVIFSDRPNSH